MHLVFVYRKFIVKIFHYFKEDKEMTVVLILVILNTDRELIGRIRKVLKETLKPLKIFLEAKLNASFFIITS